MSSDPDALEPDDAAASLPRGTVIADRYEIAQRLGVGGMGAVFAVVDRRTGRELAMKVMRPSILADADMRRRFEDEARITSGLQSEHLVPILDAGCDATTQRPYLVMERLHGETLGDVVTMRGPLPAVEVTSWAVEMARALDVTHAHGVVHRDLKPENVFLSRGPDGKVTLKLLDFGLAKIVALSQASLRSTRTLGSPLYMSPEQLGGEATIDGRADVYALGHLVFTLLAGEAYWAHAWRESRGVFPVLLRVMKGNGVRASARARELGVELPHDFDAWFEVATARDPDARFDTAGLAASELLAVVEGRRLAPRGLRARHRRALALGAGGLVLATLGVAPFVLGSTAAPAAATQPVQATLIEPTRPGASVEEGATTSVPPAAVLSGPTTPLPRAVDLAARSAGKPAARAFSPASAPSAQADPSDSR